MIYDLEVSPNYFLIGMMKIDDGEIIQYDVRGKDNKLSKKKIKKVMELLNNFTFVGFNSLNYDSPVLAEMLSGKTCEEIYEVSVDLVELDGKRWHYDKASRNQIDLMEVAAGQASLKLYGSRLFTKKLQDLPYEHYKKLTKKQCKKMKEYNVNDLHLTLDLYNELKPQLEIRSNIGGKYGINVMSRSDAQVAEDVFKKVLGIDKRPKIDIPDYVEYTAPDYVKFKTKQLKELKKKFESSIYKINKKTGKFIAQEWLKEKIIIDGNAYTIGYGGLHSNEKSLVVTGGLKNADIASMYPSLIINSGKYPIQLGENWLKLYTKFRDERMKIKHTDKKLSAMLKIFLNGLVWKTE